MAPHLTRGSIPAFKGNGFVYMNSGGSGPPPYYVLQAMRETEELFSGPAYLKGGEYFSLLEDTMARARSAAAALINANPQDVALTQNTSHGMSLAVAGLPWKQGDEVISTRAEHPGGLLPLYALKDRYGVHVKLLAPPVTVEKIEAALTSKTKLIALSHILYTNGAVLPLKQICALARSRDILTLVDGAQSAGSIPIDVKELDVDLYAFTGHKWLLGPEGMGALYVKPGTDIHSTNLGYLSLSDYSSFNYDGGYTLWSGARRFEASTMNPVLATGFSAAAAAASLRGHKQSAEIQRRANLLTLALEGLPNVTIHSPRPAASGLVSFEVEGVPAREAVRRLFEEKFILRSLPDPYPYVRASVHLFNSEAELESLTNAIANLR